MFGHYSRRGFRSFYFQLVNIGRVEFRAKTTHCLNSGKTVVGSLGLWPELASRGSSPVERFSASQFSTSVLKNNEEINERSPIGSDQSNSGGIQDLIFKEIADGDPAIEHKLKVVEFEVSVLRERNQKVPTKIKKAHWLQLLKLKNFSARRKHLIYLFKTEKKTENRIARKADRREKYLNEKENIANDNGFSYGLTSNTMFMRIYDQSLMKFLSCRLATALLYSQPILFDCSYAPYMTDLNSKFCAKQILFAFSENRLHPAPFHIKLCNVNPDDVSMKFLNQLFSSADKSIPIDSTPQSYLDLYPKEKLVYLTPHCKNVLYRFNHDDIYIIGAYVDRGVGKKLSLAKAKEANIRMAKLPIDLYLEWKKGVKSLTLNTVLKILLDSRLYGKWEKAFENVPSRFLREQTKNKSDNLAKNRRNFSLT